MLSVRQNISKIGLFAGPLLAIWIGWGPTSSQSPAVLCAAITLWMAVWWMTEAIPLWATALLPVVLVPALGILPGNAVAASYFNSTIFLFMGGFLMAQALERWNLHRRIALRILGIVGTRPDQLLLGFIASAALLSMWVSNTSTVMMLLPIGLSVLHELKSKQDEAAVSHYSSGLMLGIAYAASLGGIATLVGTPPNLTLARSYTEQFPELGGLNMAKWLIFALPLSLFLLFVLWRYLVWVFVPKGLSLGVGRDHFKKELSQLETPSYEEKWVFTLFVSLVFLWLSRAPLDMGFLKIPGWGSLFPHADYLNDGTVAIAMGLLLFVIPSKNKGGERLLEADAVARLPWGIILLFGGGLALARSIQASGLSEIIGQTGGVWASEVSPLVFILGLALAVSFMTELTSNTATAEMLMPILGALSISLHWHPLLLMAPAALACSLAFMLPVATPPNAIIFGSGKVSIGDMVKTGFVINIVAAVSGALWVWFWGARVFGF